VAIAIFAVLAAMYGNVIVHPEYLVVFLQYFIPAIIIVFILLNRKYVLQYLLIIVRSFVDSFQRQARVGEVVISKKIHKLGQQEFVYFSKADDISALNKAILYVQENEITRKLNIVTVVNENRQVTKAFMDDFDALDRAYPDIKLKYKQIEGVFGPELIERLSTEWKIPTNFMFISSPGDRFTYRLADLKGVRLIM
jgi:hypothetical protein